MKTKLTLIMALGLISAAVLVGCQKQETPPPMPEAPPTNAPATPSTNTPVTP